MKNLKQTRLSFAPAPKQGTPTTRSKKQSASVSAPEESPSKTPKSKQGAQSTGGPSRSKALECVEIPPPPQRRSRKKTATSATPVRSSPRKRATIAPPTQPRKPSLKRKHSTGGAGSDDEGTPKVAHILRTTEPSYFAKNKTNTSRSPPKKIRLSSPESDLTPLPSSSACGLDSDELVPTSQSEEQELTLPRIPSKDAAAVQESVAQWRKETHASPPTRAQSPAGYNPCDDINDTTMNVDLGPFDELPRRPSTQSVQYPQTPRSLSGGSSHQSHQDAAPATVTLPSSLPLHFQTPERPRPAAVQMASPSEAFSSLTPPPSSDPMSPPEADEEPEAVQVLDVQSKTEQIIAAIKSRALAAAHSSPEQSPMNLDAFSDSESDSSDDDDSHACGGLAAALGKGMKGKGTTKHAQSPSTAGPSKSEPASAPRYNLRRVSPKSAKPVPVPLTQPRKPRKTDPLDALLRQKAREERTGTGMAAIREAEAAYASSIAKKGLKDEIDDEDGSGSDDDWVAGLAMLRATAQGANGKGPRTPARRKGKRSTLGSDEEDSEYEAIPGSKRGKAVGKILESDLRDKKAKELAKLNEEPVGVPLWSVAAEGQEDDGMDVDATLPDWPMDASGNCAFDLLRTAVDQNDTTQVSALLSMGVVASMRREQIQRLVPWIFELVFSDVPHSLGRLAYTQLMRLPSVLGEYSSGLRVSSALSALVRLGAQSSTLEQFGWAVPAAQTSKVALDNQKRDELVYRFVTLLSALAHPAMGNQLIDFFLILVLIGMDPGSSDDILTDVRKSCDNVALAMEAAQADTFDLEAPLCEKLVAFGKPLSPVCQERLLSLMPCISSSTTRMARNLARSLLLDVSSSARSYEKLPDLSPIIDLISPPFGSGGYFDVVGNAKQDGYFDALTCRIFLLSRALSDIDEYTIQEMRAAKEQAAREKERLEKEKAEGGASEEDEKEAEEREKEAPLERIRRLLNELHGKIFDTKAAHLDRSRAKAALQQLEYRVHYQRAATLKSGWGRPRTLHRYFPGASSKS
ncbi:hypothetical protein FKP32DRAFT_1664342 [Trametes sanguinea]|nr:hypothetical protein FKP32DRAFT_1664342 [Trametes sanguinea]